MGNIRKITEWAGCIIFSICLILTLLISSFDIGAYADFNFYEKEYQKYKVYEDLQMEMTDVMEVTKEMMAFLRGNRENLIINTKVNGQEREFFNEDEISHMEDVKILFVGGLRLRTAAFSIMAVLIVIALLLKAQVKKVLPKAYQYTALALTGITGIVIALFASDFDRYFVVFHKIFFSQGNWQFDPDSSLMINMLPEGFFADIAARIGFIFIGFLVISLALATGLRISQKRRAGIKK